jgi:hypothetical protein
MNSSFLVKAHQHQPQRITCSLADLFVARIPVPVVFFYQAIIPQETFIHALETALSDFPIFAGILIKEQDQLYIDCNNQGVQVRIEHLTEPLAITSELTTQPSNHFVDLIRPNDVLKHKKPLLTIRLHYHPNGMTIGYCWHHTLGDMATFMTFLSAVSLCAQNKPCSTPLIIQDRDNYLQDWLTTHAKTSTHRPFDRLISMNALDILRFIKHLCTRKQVLYVHFEPSMIDALKQQVQTLTGKKVSRNDVVCAHVLHLIAKHRNDHAKHLHTAIAVNYRPRLQLDASLLGNYVDTLSLQCDRQASVAHIASHIHDGIAHHIEKHFSHANIHQFIESFGSLKKLNRMLPRDMMPKYKNLIISNWCNFGVYAIDFGVTAPSFFLPIGEAPFPWLSCIVEAPKQAGLLMTLVLPSRLAKRVAKHLPLFMA